MFKACMRATQMASRLPFGDLLDFFQRLIATTMFLPSNLREKSWG